MIKLDDLKCPRCGGKLFRTVVLYFKKEYRCLACRRCWRYDEGKRALIQIGKDD